MYFLEFIKNIGGPYLSFFFDFALLRTYCCVLARPLVLPPTAVVPVVMLVPVLVRLTVVLLIVAAPTFLLPFAVAVVSLLFVPGPVPLPLLLPLSLPALRLLWLWGQFSHNPSHSCFCFVTSPLLAACG